MMVMDLLLLAALLPARILAAMRLRIKSGNCNESFDGFHGRIPKVFYL